MVYVFMIYLQYFSSINPFDDNLFPRGSDQLEEMVRLRGGSPGPGVKPMAEDHAKTR